MGADFAGAVVANAFADPFSGPPEKRWPFQTAVNNWNDNLFLQSAMNWITVSLLATATAVSATLFLIHLGFRAPRRIEKGSPADFGLPYRETGIRTRSGKTLFAWWVPAAMPAPTIILLHGWGGNAELMLPLALPLHGARLNVFLLDARNHGRSDSATFSSLPRFAEDVAEAIDWVRRQGGNQTDRVVLLGHSVGGGAVLFEASRRRDIAAVISIGAFAHPEWMMRRYLGRFRIPELFTAWVLRYVEWIIGHRYEEIAPMYTSCRITCPVLLIHGTADKTVPVTDALAIRNNCNKESVELLLIENADHESVALIEEHAGQLISFLTRVGVLG
jgi:pimeloyl-ACP methyl ester carboxylesterase